MRIPCVLRAVGGQSSAVFDLAEILDHCHDSKISRIINKRWLSDPAVLLTYCDVISDEGFQMLVKEAVEKKLLCCTFYDPQALEKHLNSRESLVKLAQVDMDTAAAIGKFAQASSLASTQAAMSGIIMVGSIMGIGALLVFGFLLRAEQPYIDYIAAPLILLGCVYLVRSSWRLGSYQCLAAFYDYRGRQRLFVTSDDTQGRFFDPGFFDKGSGENA